MQKRSAAPHVTSLWLELGPRWSEPALEACLRTVGELPSPGQRVFSFTQTLAGTPFAYESMLPVPPLGCLRVRLETLDCATLVYTVLAMAHARTLRALVGHLARIRYVDGAAPIDSAPEHGNILGYSSECLLTQAIRLGYLRDVTAEVAGTAATSELALELHASRRPKEHDPDEQLERPRFGEGVRRARYLPRESLSQARWAAIEPGDIIAFTRGPRLKDGSANTDLINHLAIADRVDDEVSFIHATRHFAWNPAAAPDAPARFTGVFYGDDRRREQIGTGPATVAMGDDIALDVDGHRLFGYDVARRRSLADFTRSIFAGLFVLRPTTPCDLHNAAIDL